MDPAACLQEWAEAELKQDFGLATERAQDYNRWVESGGWKACAGNVEIQRVRVVQHIADGKVGNEKLFVSAATVKKKGASNKGC